jgi:23S rRNA (guanosine2251-2'-O)-methyltransferase
MKKRPMRSQGRQQPRQPEKPTPGRWVIGIHAVEEAMRIRPKSIIEFWLKNDFVTNHALKLIADDAEAKRLRVQLKSPGQLDQVGPGHQGIAAKISETPKFDWTQLDEKTTCLVVILDGLEDPQNLGAILRTSWLSGVTAILIPEARAASLTPTVCKVASGGAEHVPVESVSNLANSIKLLKDKGFWIYGLSEKGTKKPWDLKLSGKVAWVVGSESGGMRITTERVCDELVRLPQISSGSSYNAAIAAGMALGETCRQFGEPF